MSDGKHEACSCRPWVEQELAKFKAELADEVRTRRLVVTSEGQGSVSIQTTEESALVQVNGPDGRVTVHLVASSVEGSTLAGIAIGVLGDIVAELAAVDSPEGYEARLVFDNPDTDGPWTQVDANGIEKYP